jgi:hypothetical protein
LREAPSEARRLALCWFLPGFALISAVSGKLFVYLVPLLPPLALLVAAGLPAPWEEEAAGTGRLSGTLCGLFFFGAGVVALYGLARHLPAELWRLAPAWGFLLALGLILLALAARPKRLLWALLGGSCLLSWLLWGLGATQLNPYFSASELGARLASARQAGYELAQVDIARGTLSFYAGSEIRQLSHGELGPALDEPGRLAVVIRHKKRGLIPRKVLDRLALACEFARLEFEGYSLYLEIEAPGGLRPSSPASDLKEISLAFQYRLV